MFPLSYVIDSKCHDKDDMCRVNQRVLCARQHGDAPTEAYYAEGQQPPFAPTPQKERKKVERYDKPAEVGAGERREHNQIGKQQAEDWLQGQQQKRQRTLHPEATYDGKQQQDASQHHGR